MTRPRYSKAAPRRHDAGAQGGAVRDAVVERLLTLAREELGADIAYLEPLHPAALEPPPSGAVDVPLPLPEGKSGGMLRFTPSADAAEAERDVQAIRALAAMLGSQLEAPALDRESWQLRIMRIRDLLDHGDLPVVFQPIANLQTGEIVGVEALSRFPGSSDHAPDKWFNEAASVGLGVELEVLAVRRALNALDQLPESAYLSVNVSPAVAMSAGLAETLDEVPLHRVVLEITEHSQVLDYDRLNLALVALRARGVRLAIDDAGSGFSSLRHILRLSPDIIKLDMSLTQGIDNDSVLRALGYSLASFASAIDAAVIAEGVETERELHALRFLQVSYGQGFFLRRPGPMPMPDRLDGEVFG
ncbi:MAG TPA: EAL domain-containing protein [Egibacteraceae bacterium]|nr:EAL domain-containing protein [Egibacteraceae bacterium]